MWLCGTRRRMPSGQSLHFVFPGVPPNPILSISLCCMNQTKQAHRTDVPGPHELSTFDRQVRIDNEEARRKLCWGRKEWGFESMLGGQVGGGLGVRRDTCGLHRCVADRLEGGHGP